MRLGKLRIFSDREAWLLFRIAAISEAVGWTGLGCAVVFHANPTLLLVAGRIHGTIFSAYILAVVGLTPSLRWTWPRMFIAGLASIPPYGSLIFEAWESRRRQQQQAVGIVTPLLLRRAEKMLVQ